MPLEQTVEITQIAVLTHPRKSPLFPVVLSALDDVARFYSEAGADGELVIPVPGSDAQGRVHVRFERRTVGTGSVKEFISLDDVLPAGFVANLNERQVRTRGLGSAVESSSSWAPPESSAAAEGSVESSAGPSRTVDARVLGPAIQTLLEPRGWSLIVTDLELTPPPDWRYIIWDGFPQGAVASITPLDPVYWREAVESDTHRALVVKNRIRAACMSVVGSLLGMERCGNEECFLYFNVDTLLRLDEMRFIGPEHGVRELAFRGFWATDDPLVTGGIENLEGRR